MIGEGSWEEIESDWRRWVAGAGLMDELRGSDVMAVSFSRPAIAWGKRGENRRGSLGADR